MPKNQFLPQPYEQLAKVMREQGHIYDARDILIAREKARRERTGLFSARKIWMWFLSWSCAYGYKPFRAAHWLLLIWFIGLCVFHFAGTYGGMMQAKKRDYLQKTANQSDGDRLMEYPTFSCAFYSLDCMLPLVNLHQEDYWMPNSKSLMQ